MKGGFELKLKLDDSTKRQLERLNVLLNRAFSSSDSVPEGVKKFINFLEESDDEFFKKIIPEIQRYYQLLKSQTLFDLIRSSINDLWNGFCEILPNSVRVKFISRRKSVESTIRKIVLNALIGKEIRLNDIFAFRIIIDSLDGEEKNIEYCEIAKNFCIQYFKNKRKCKLICVKDRIKNPKDNGYMSIHLIFDFISKDTDTATVMPSFEIQIRTMNMDIENEYGSASHTAFKDNQYEAVKVIKINVNNIKMPHFNLVKTEDDETIIVDNIGLVKALHVEERHKTF